MTDLPSDGREWSGLLDLVRLTILVCAVGASLAFPDGLDANVVARSCAERAKSLARMQNRTGSELSLATLLNSQLQLF